VSPESGAADRALLEEGLEELRRRHPEVFPPTGALIPGLELLLDEVQLWNRRVRLISGSRSDIIVRHLLDSLAALPVLQALEIEETADAGSGNGFPALPLLLSDERLRCTLIERGAKKAAYLRNAVSLLGLTGRAEVLEQDVIRIDRRFSLVMSRAFMPIHTAYPLLRKTVGKSAVILFFAGTRRAIEKELSLLRQEQLISVQQVEIIPVQVPFLEEERHLCVFSEKK
jgi:16S rRNA (guanine527-N7)-methyltransferase